MERALPISGITSNRRWKRSRKRTLYANQVSKYATFDILASFLTICRALFLLLNNSTTNHDGSTGISSLDILTHAIVSRWEKSSKKFRHFCERMFQLTYHVTIAMFDFLFGCMDMRTITAKTTAFAIIALKQFFIWLDNSRNSARSLLLTYFEKVDTSFVYCNQNCIRCATVEVETLMNAIESIW